MTYPVNVKAEGYVKAENMSELNQASNLTSAMHNGMSVPYTWSDQTEQGYQQHILPQQTTQQIPSNMKKINNNTIKFKESNDDKKIFIGGLHYNTTKEILTTYFSKFGNLEDAVVIKNPETQRSRGFGFVTFSSQEEVDECQKNRPHTLDGKQVETKRAVPRGIQGNSSRQARGAGPSTAEHKVFVGGIKEEVDDEDLKTYFSTFGNVKQVKILVDKNTGRKRGFAFVEFDDYDPVHKCILQRTHQIRGQRVDVKNAVNRRETSYGPRSINQPRNSGNMNSNYSWMNGGGGYGQPNGYTWDYYNAYGAQNGTAAAPHMGYGAAMPDAYGYSTQAYGGVPPPPQTGEAMMPQMYPGYNGAPNHGYANGMAASGGGGPIRTPPHNKGYRQAPYQTSDNEHKKQ